jgi:hypothetical protein
MLDKFSQLAEQAATNVSRRQFLERFGRSALAVAAAAGAVLALPVRAQAGRRGCEPGWHKCTGRCSRTCCPDGYYCCMRRDRGDREPYCSCC